MAGMETVGYPAASVANGTLPLTGNEQIPADTQLTGGTFPETEYITSAQLVSFDAAAQALTDAATIVTDLSAATKVFTVTLAGNRTLANPTNLTSGRSWKVYITQDATGARTLAYGTNYTFSGGTPTLTTTPAAVDSLSFTYDGVKIRGVASLKYA